MAKFNNRTEANMHEVLCAYRQQQRHYNHTHRCMALQAVEKAGLKQVG